MKLLIDTNVVLDVLLKRAPFYETAMDVIGLVKQDDIQEYVSASAVTDIYYIAVKQMRDRQQALELLKRLLMLVSVAAVSEREIRNALELEWIDFEDSVQYSVALLSEMDGIITRNPEDYKDAKLPVLLPEQALKQFLTQSQN